jgi:hypothetical protein
MERGTRPTRVDPCPLRTHVNRVSETKARPALEILVAHFVGVPGQRADARRALNLLVKYHRQRGRARQ